MQDELIKELSAFGAVENEVRLLDAGNSSFIDYLDLLIPIKSSSRKLSLCPDAVIELEGRPALYVLKADHLTGDESVQRHQLQQLRRAIACRGDEAPLAIIQPGQVVLFASDSMTALPDPLLVKSDDPAAPMLIRDLLAGADLPDYLCQFSLKPQQRADKEAIYDLLFRLLNEVTDALLASTPLSDKHDEVLSLVGRALFTRFLIDRGIINEQTFHEIYSNGKSAEDCLSNPETAAQTCKWLEVNFNGELLPLPDKDFLNYFKTLVTPDMAIFRALSKILYRTTASGQLHLDWGFIDFAHVPVGLLSQVYERYAHKWFDVNAKSESVHYTPHHIATLVVSQSFEGITTAPKHLAKVCDPAAGAGIFLVLAFRRLIAEKWKIEGRRPNKDEIREVLYNQIRGFDINEHALKLAALSLYLTALELDPDPFPPSALKFKKLQGLSLIATRLKGEDYPIFPVLGSLGPAIGKEHNEKYDLVIGNPPWTSWDGADGNEINKTVEIAVKKIAEKRNRNGQLSDVVSAYQNPDLVPDLPFIWKSMELAKKDGVIGLVLHGRLLFKRTKIAIKARDSIFRALRVTGLLNGAGLKSAEVWPGINQPFCILFAKNRIPDAQDAFYFVSPERDASLNSKSIIRIDYQSAQPVEWKVLEEKPFLLKTMFLGTALDVELIERLRALMLPSTDGVQPLAVRFDDYWSEVNGLHATQGYRVAKRDKDASHIVALGGGKLTSADRVGYLINSDSLPPFEEYMLERSRKPQNYLPPLVVIKKAPGHGDEQIRARLVLGNKPVIFNESFLGYSAHKRSDGEELACYLFLIANSDLYLYYNLMTSSRFGVERRVTYVEDLKDFPIVPFDALPKKVSTQCKKLALEFANGSATRNEVNDWVCNAYSLDPSDRSVIRDTLDIRMPYKDVSEIAEREPVQSEIDAFAINLQNSLQPYFALTEEVIGVRSLDVHSDAWRFIEVASSTAKSLKSNAALLAQLAQGIADQAGSSRIFVTFSGSGRLVVGMLAKYRYWTQTRARLCATDILRAHSQEFPIAK